jgi:hypothetical protein
MTIELNLREGSAGSAGSVINGVPGVSIPDAILALVRAMIAQSDPVLREQLVRSFEALWHNGQIRPMRSEQVATFLAQLVSDIAYAARDPEQTTPRPIAHFLDPRLLAAAEGSA